MSRLGEAILFIVAVGAVGALLWVASLLVNVIFFGAGGPPR